MSRLEKYKEIRQIRRKYFISVSLVLLLLISGLTLADNSLNYLMTGERRPGVFSINQKDDLYLEVRCFGYKFDINTFYIKRDYQNLKNSIEKLLGFK